MAKLNFTPQHHAPTCALDVARSYIRAGIAVFPCREMDQEGIDYSTGEFVTFPEKSPYTAGGLKGATKSARIVDILFGDRYPAAAIGVPTGEALGAWVLDLDRHGDRDGHSWLAEMEAKHGPLPATGRATTANGGTHIFFNHVPGIRNRAAIAPGVDTRGEGGYILSPGSVMADGRTYKWDDWEYPGLPPLADAPDWLLAMVLPAVPEPVQPRQEYTYKPQIEGNAPYVDGAVKAEVEKLASAGVGNRGFQLFASACALGEFVAAGAITRGDAEAELYAAACACGVAQKDGERTTRNSIKRGLDKTKSKPREIPDRANNDDTAVDPDMVRRLVENSLRKRAAEQAGPAPEPDKPPPPENKPRVRARFEKTWFDEIEEGAPKDTFIKGVFGNGEFTTVSGLPGTGKSVIVTDMACHVAVGMEWHGRRVKQGLVVYVAAERKKLTERRMMAFRKRHGVENVPLLLLGGRLDFTKDLKDARDLIAAIREAELETGMACVWVIIDTLTRVFGGGDQNASKDMTRFVQSCDEILTETKAHVTAIHHSAWSGERGKGAIDLDGAVDSSFMVKKDHGKYQFICDGANDGEEGTILAFTMDSVEVGRDEDGEPTTAPVVVPADKMEAGERLVDNIKGHNARALEVLRELVSTSGGSPESPHFPEDAIVVKEESWRQACYADARDGTPQGTLKTRYNRALKFLKESGQIGHIGEWVFVK